MGRKQTSRYALCIFSVCNVSVRYILSIIYEKISTYEILDSNRLHRIEYTTIFKRATLGSIESLKTLTTE